MDESGTYSRSAPLPPVTTRWDPPAPAEGSAASPLVPPFIQPELPPPPVDDEPMPVLPAAEAPPGLPLQQAVRMPGEPLMPWEEEPVAESQAQSGPVVTAEQSDSTRSDLDDWESAIDPNGGQALPGWGDDAVGDAFSPPPQLDDEGAVMAEPESADQAFPLDAFFIPPDAKRLPKGLEHAEELHVEIAEALAKRLEGVAQRLRREGFTGLLHPADDDEPIDTLLAGLLAGYLADRTDS